MAMTTPVFRFAPSPNGQLHLGHALSAILNFEAARAAGGRFLLRIEDIDRARCTPELEETIFHDLSWLGLHWETPVRRQSDHFGDYRAALDRLAALGLVYPAYLTRAEIAGAVAHAEAAGKVWPRDPDGAPLYPGDAAVLGPETLHQRIASGAGHALRLDMTKALRLAGGPLFWEETGAGPDGERGQIAADPARWGDVVLARKDTPTSYHLSVVIDDASQGVTHVMRGQDLFQATAVHRLLQQLLDLPQPVYHHHRLVLDETGRKLSKSRGDTALGALREKGASPKDIRRMIGL